MSETAVSVMKPSPSPKREGHVKSFARRVVKNLPGVRYLDSLLCRHYTGSDRREPFRRGHYYSPLPDYQEIERHAESIFSQDVDLSGSIDLRSNEQLHLLRDLSKYYQECDWPTSPQAGVRFYVPNGWFDEGDAISLYCIFRHFSPHRVIEVGSGFSSALMLDTNERRMNRSVTLTFIDPCPEARLQALLSADDDRQVRIVKDIVQALPIDTFTLLKANDVLFIDSSHVSKSFSDVNYLLFDVLPVLQPGVLVHFHDIFWPFEYPKEWVMQGRAWNEAYILRAFLQYNTAFEIVLFNSYLGYTYPAVLNQLMPKFLTNTGGSLWLRKR